MSGTESQAADAALARLEAVLDRRTSVAPVGQLAKAFAEQGSNTTPLANAALGFDTNAILRLPQLKQSADDILDYLSGRTAPFILPGQAVQEMWNNLHVIETVANSIEKAFNQLREKVEQIDPSFESLKQKMSGIVEEFREQYGHTYDENTRTGYIKMLRSLESSALCCYVPRSQFAPLAHVRKRTKTPPGFKDELEGDFFVWADFLYGLLHWQLRTPNNGFSEVILVTEDKKKDWSLSGTPHPILSSEVDALFKVPFRLWDLRTLSNAVKEAI